MVFLVAGEALFVVGLGVSAFERDDLGLVAVVGGVSLAGAVAFFAGVFEIELGAFLQDGMGVLIEGLGQVVVAHGAVFVVDATGLGLCPLLGGILGGQPVKAACQNSSQGSYHSEQEQVLQNLWSKRHGNLDYLA